MKRIALTLTALLFCATTAMAGPILAGKYTLEGNGYTPATLPFFINGMVTSDGHGHLTGYTRSAGFGLPANQVCTYNLAAACITGLIPEQISCQVTNQVPLTGPNPALCGTRGTTSTATWYGSMLNPTQANFVQSGGGIGQVHLSKGN